MQLDMAIGAAEHARKYGYESYMVRAAVALLDEVKRLRAEQQRNACPAELGRPGADSCTLGGAS